MKKQDEAETEAQGTTHAQNVFDVCWGGYRAARGNGDLQAIDAGALSEQKWRPAHKPKLEDYQADFALAGKAALKDRPSRMVLFRVYYLSLAPYDSARHFLGIGEMTWAQWTEEIRGLVGAELERRGIWPLETYFGGIKDRGRTTVHRDS